MARLRFSQFSAVRSGLGAVSHDLVTNQLVMAAA